MRCCRPETLRGSVRDVHVDTVVVTALVAQRDLARSPFALPRDFGVVLLDLVEQNDVARALEAALVDIVSFLDLAVEVPLDDLRGALRRPCFS